jgi:hypothetical protein
MRHLRGLWILTEVVEGMRRMWRAQWKLQNQEAFGLKGLRENRLSRTKQNWMGAPRTLVRTWGTHRVRLVLPKPLLSRTFGIHPYGSGCRVRLPKVCLKSTVDRGE